MTEERKRICALFESMIPRMDETKKALLLAYGEGLDAGMAIGLQKAGEKMAEDAADEAVARAFDTEQA